MTDTDERHYGCLAYRTDNIPEQAPLRTRPYQSCSVRLSWGKTQQTTSIKLMEESTPEKMRFWKEVAKEKEEKKRRELMCPHSTRKSNFTINVTTSISDSRLFHAGHSFG